MLPVVGDLHPQGDHGDDETHQGADEDPAQGPQGDALAVIQGGAGGPQGGVPEPAVQCLEVAVFLQLQDDLGDLLVEVAALLHGHRVRLLGEGLADLAAELVREL